MAVHVLAGVALGAAGVADEVHAALDAGVVTAADKSAQQREEGPPEAACTGKVPLLDRVIDRDELGRNDVGGTDHRPGRSLEQCRPDTRVPHDENRTALTAPVH